MSTSLLYHGFGIRGYYYVSPNYIDGGILFKIKHDFWKLNCPDCNSRDFNRRDTITKLYNEKLTELRRDLQRDAEGSGKEVLKGTRWLLLKSSKKLNTLNEECDKLKNALRLNEPLSKAYYLKDDLG